MHLQRSVVVRLKSQVNKLAEGTDILIATPGRLLDHLAQGAVCLDDIRFFVLDETGGLHHAQLPEDESSGRPPGVARCIARAATRWSFRELKAPSSAFRYIFEDRAG